MRALHLRDRACPSELDVIERGPGDVPGVAKRRERGLQVALGVALMELLELADGGVDQLLGGPTSEQRAYLPEEVLIALEPSPRARGEVLARALGQRGDVLEGGPSLFGEQRALQMEVFERWAPSRPAQSVGDVV